MNAPFALGRPVARDERTVTGIVNRMLQECAHSCPVFRMKIVPIRLLVRMPLGRKLEQAKQCVRPRCLAGLNVQLPCAQIRQLFGCN